MQQRLHRLLAAVGAFVQARDLARRRDDIGTAASFDEAPAKIAARVDESGTPPRRGNRDRRPAQS